MITDDERFIKIQGILALSDIHPNDCIKINDLIIDLSKQKQHLQSVIDKAIDLVNTRLRDVNLRYGIDNEFREEYDELLEILRSNND